MQTAGYSQSERRQRRQLLVENKLSFTGTDTELSIYDTYRASEGVGLDAGQLLYCGMVKGTKIMHDPGNREGELFIPHESYVMPPGESVDIDFPDASEDQPTTCLTIEISPERVKAVSERMRDTNTNLAQVDHDWEYRPGIVHKHHTSETQKLLERLVALYTGDHPDKDLLVDLGITELVVRLLREQGREVVLSYCLAAPDSNGIVSAIDFMQQNLAAPLDINQLCGKACMSRSRLFVEFKKHLGCTPGEFQQQLRLKRAADTIRNGLSITEACFNSGFSDLSHFSRRFRHCFGVSPSGFQKQQMSFPTQPQGSD